MPITKDRYYKTLLMARDKLRQEGFLCPRIEEKHILLCDDEYQFALDLDMAEERKYRASLIRLDEIICGMLDIPNKPMEKGFWLHYDENFSREIPECWKTKSIEENATKEFDINGKELDKYQTYSKEKSSEPEKKPEKEEKNNDTYYTTKFPDTYS